MVFADDHAQYVEIAGDGGVRMRRLNTGDGDRKRPTPGSKCLISFSVVPAEEQGDGGRVDKHVHETFILGAPDVPLAIDIALQHMMQVTTPSLPAPPLLNQPLEQGDEFDLLVSDAYMRETIIQSAGKGQTGDSSAHADGSADAAASDVVVDAAHTTPSNAASSTETSGADTVTAAPSFDTHARHTRIRVFLHSFKGAVLCVHAARPHAPPSRKIVQVHEAY